MKKSNSIEKLLWSIALPGFGQFLNNKYLKGLLLVILEFLINVKARLNEVIIPSFHGDIDTAISLTNYQWLMFYPCIYMFALWDAYRDNSGENVKPLMFLPFVFAAFIGTIGVIYSASFRFLGVLFGPIWLPILSLIVGAVLGFGIRRALIQLI